MPALRVGLCSALAEFERQPADIHPFTSEWGTSEWGVEGVLNRWEGEGEGQLSFLQLRIPWHSWHHEE